jgi:hypothetical protein
MGPLGTAGVGGGPPSRRRRGEPSPEEPALQGPFRRRGEIRLLAAQHHADQARTPGRVFPAEAQGGLQNGLRGLRGGLSTSVVRGEESVWTATSQAAEQTTDGPRGEAQGRGDSRTVLAILESPPEGLADGHGEGTRHGTSSIGDTMMMGLPVF